MYEYKILSHNERKYIFILEEIKIPKHITKDLCKELLQFHINIYLLKENIINAKDYYKNYFVKIEILIKILILICWLYILIVSLHTLHFTDLELAILEKFKENWEPFSGLLMDKITNSQSIK